MTSLNGAARLARARVIMLTRGHLLPRPDAPAVGGAGRQCLKLSRALAQEGQPVAILTDRLAWRDPAHGVVQGVPVVYVNSGRPLVYRRGFGRLGLYAYMFGALAYLVRHRQEFDVIHAHSARLSGFLAVLAARWLGKKSVFKVMNSGVRNDVRELAADRSLFGARHMMRYLRHCDAVVALNPAVCDELVEMGFRSDQIELIPNGVEVAEIQPKTTYTNAGECRLIFVGRLAPSKGLDRLLAAVHWLSTHAPEVDCHLDIVGRGELQVRLAAQADALGISQRVRFLGEVDDVGRQLVEADVFVLPSYGEGTSNAMLEAMAAGLPCVTTDTPGNNLLVEHNQAGLLVQHNNDAAELGEAIARLARSPEMRERLGRAARERVENNYDIRATARRYIDFYQRLLGNLATAGLAGSQVTGERLWRG